jgi:hypothetical protein
MQQWEYMHLFLKNDWTDTMLFTLNAKGAEGWDLVTVISPPKFAMGTSVYQHIAVLKRPVLK